MPDTPLCPHCKRVQAAWDREPFWPSARNPMTDDQLHDLQIEIIEAQREGAQPDSGFMERLSMALHELGTFRRYHGAMQIRVKFLKEPLTSIDLPEPMRSLAIERDRARSSGDWNRADEIKQSMLDAGYRPIDAREQTLWLGL